MKLGSNNDYGYHYLKDFEKRFELIDQAKESIYLLVWYIYPDATGKEISRRIAAKASEGVDVKIIVDGKIAMRSSGNHSIDRP